MVAMEGIINYYSNELMRELRDLRYKNGDSVFNDDQIALYKLYTENVMLKALCEVQICIATGDEWEAPVDEA